MRESQQLLAEYAKSGSDNAFREIVHRYVDLVYSTALRLVEGDTHRAQDVSQTVFVDLARMAPTVAKEVRLGGWLHRRTCFVAATLMRGERRRQSRERQAVEMNTLQNTAEADFSQVAPLLDEAINELGEADRTAILLRFFEQHDFRTVGQALGSNEDAARMRVTRAVEKLANLLKRRGVTASSVTLGVALGANAVQAAPVGLAATISTAAVALVGTSLAATATATASKAIAMTTLQKTLLTAILASVFGVVVYEAGQVAGLRNKVRALQEQQAPWADQVQQLQKQRDDTASRLAALQQDNERLRNAIAEAPKLRDEIARLQNEAERDAQSKAGAAESEVETELAKINKLKQLAEQMPDKIIPELQYLMALFRRPEMVDGNYWRRAAETAKYETDAERRHNLSVLRRYIKRSFAQTMVTALTNYTKAQAGQLPTELSQLKPYWYPSHAVTDAILQRYQMVKTGNVSDLQPDAVIITEKGVVDDQDDSILQIGMTGYRLLGTGASSNWSRSWTGQEINSRMQVVR